VAGPLIARVKRVYDGTETTVQLQDSTESAFRDVDTERPWGTPTDLKTANCFAGFGDIVLCDPTGGAFTVTLPEITSQDVGKRVTVKNYSVSMNAIYVVGKNGETIDLLSSIFLAIPYQCRTFAARRVGEWIQVVV
jgi:hypothetical protein